MRHEIDRRRREALQRSLRSPHPDSAQHAEDGFDDWASGLPDEDVTGLVDVRPTLQAGSSGLSKTSCALIDHLRSVDKRRVRRVFAQLPRPEMDAVDEGLALFLGLADRFGPPPAAVQ